MNHRAVCWAAGDRNRGEQCLGRHRHRVHTQTSAWHVAHMSQHCHYHVALKLQRFGLGGGGAGIPTTSPPRLKQLISPPRPLHVPSTSQATVIVESNAQRSLPSLGKINVSVHQHNHVSASKLRPVHVNPDYDTMQASCTHESYSFIQGTYGTADATPPNRVLYMLVVVCYRRRCITRDGTNGQRETKVTYWTFFG